MASLQIAMDAMRWAADSDRVGYSQSDRWGVVFFGDGYYNADCSSLQIQALRYAGFDTGDASYTGNMSAELCARGWKRVPADGNPKAGDILLNDRCHVAMWLGDCLAQASIDENGNIAGGARGDQTGAEVNTRGYYDYPWDCYLRWEGAGEGDDDQVQLVNNEGGPIYRLYNPNAGSKPSHHFTPSASERDSLKRAGWRDEGVAFTAKQSSRHPVYRMYNPNNGDHLYTVSFDEASSLQKQGWRWEGVPFFANSEGTPVYTMYNPNSGEHFMTADQNERANLERAGWKYDRGFTV